MSTKPFGASFLLLSSLLSGCVTPPPPQKEVVAPPVQTRGASILVQRVPSPGCSTPEGHVTINQVTITSSGTTIKVNPGQKLIPRTASRIRWNFAGNKYAFTDNGILFDKVDGSSKSIGQPFGPIDYGHGNNLTEYVVCFGDTSSLPDSTWSYNIRFYEKDAPTIVWRCDPTLVNSQSEGGTEQIVTCVRDGS